MASKKPSAAKVREYTEQFNKFDKNGQRLARPECAAARACARDPKAEALMLVRNELKHGVVGNGKISAQELASAMRQLGQHPTEREVRVSRIEGPNMCTSCDGEGDSSHSDTKRVAVIVLSRAHEAYRRPLSNPRIRMGMVPLN